MEFAAWNSASALKSYGVIYGQVVSSTASSETGALASYVYTSGTLVEALNVARAAVRPGDDNSATLGAASYRWSELFCGNATINTSDQRMKTELEAISPALIRAFDRIEFGQFRWLEAVERKGDDARVHFGAIAQQVIAAFEAEGLDPFAYGMVCRDLIVEPYIVTEAYIERTPATEENGTPVLDENGEPVVTEREVPAEWGERPLIDPETGKQADRLGLRYGQLAALASAVYAAKMVAVEVRLAALEARPLAKKLGEK